MARSELRRRLSVGAEVQPGGGVHFRVWAPKRRRVDVMLEGPRGLRSVELTPEPGGYHAGIVPEAGVGSRYRYRLDEGDALPDPASRFQPEGPHGPSEVVDPGAYRWADESWEGIRLEGQVLYEVHVGTFTKEGTLEAAARELPELRRLGVTTVELMPLAEFPGRFGWGYDGVDLFAPTRLYGRPDDLRRFVDAAHASGLGVILDVVYNHLGPDGNYLAHYADEYFSDRYENEWGEPMNFDGPRSEHVRAFFAENAAYWVSEFHLDGLRLDATQSMHDASERHVLVEIAERARRAAGTRSILLLAENEPQQARLLRPASRGGYGLDAAWNDDFHHSAIVAATGRREAYYADTLGTPQELVSALRFGFLFQGQRYAWQKKRRGSPALDLPAPRFVLYLENHDQLANSGRGQRLHRLVSPGRHRAMTALLLLAPGTPMLFQGQEFSASSPFHYFADHAGELGDNVRRGRREFMQQFESLKSGALEPCQPDPSDPATFERSKLDSSERATHAEAYALHADLLRLRREDPVFSAQRSERMHGAVLGPEALLLRFLGEDGDDRLLLLNLGADLRLPVLAEPLAAPPEGRRWKLLWTSENPRYGGCGTPDFENDEGFRVQGHAAVVLAAVAEDAHGPPGARTGRA